MEVLIKIRIATSHSLCGARNIWTMKTHSCSQTFRYISTLGFMGEQMIASEWTPRLNKKSKTNKKRKRATQSRDVPFFVKRYAKFWSINACFVQWYMGKIFLIFTWLINWLVKFSSKLILFLNVPLIIFVCVQFGCSVMLTVRFVKYQSNTFLLILCVTLWAPQPPTPPGYTYLNTLYRNFLTIHPYDLGLYFYFLFQRTHKHVKTKPYMEELTVRTFKLFENTNPKVMQNVNKVKDS